MAARFAQISHYLSAPLDLICRAGQFRELVQNAPRELDYILPSVYPRERSEHTLPWTYRTHGLLKVLTANDPILDLIRVVTAPTPFHFTPGTPRFPTYG